MSDDEATRVGLCVRCAHVQRNRSDRGGVFYFCRRALDDPRFPKYPRIPVRECGGFREVPIQST
jgi:hypothetical protein